MSKNPFAKYPLRYWYLNPDIDPNDPDVIQEYYWKQVNAGKEEIEKRQRQQEQNQNIEFNLSQKDLNNLEKELQKAFDGMNITIKL